MYVYIYIYMYILATLYIHIHNYIKHDDLTRNDNTHSVNKEKYIYKQIVKVSKYSLILSLPNTNLSVNKHDM